MARKKKRLTRKELKQQRQAVVERRRKERGWQPPKPRAEPDQEILDDMLPLFPMVGESMPGPAIMESIMMSLLDSADLIDEPEFEGIFIDPMRCMETFAEVGQEYDLDPETFDRLSAEEREDQQLELLEKVTGHLLTGEMRQEIVEALNKLRLRLKRSGKTENIPRVAALQMFLGGDEQNSEIWPMMGLVQAIVQRSLAAGFELIETTEAVMEEIGDADNGETPFNLVEKLAQSSAAQKADKLINKIPGLGGFLQKQSDKIWDEGVSALFSGELYLELYTEEEIETGFSIFKDIFGKDDEASSKLSDSNVKALVSRIDAYITQLFTPERLDQLRTRLDTVWNESEYPKKYAAFILMLKEYTADEAAAENEKGTLVHAFIGEIKTVGMALEEAEA